MKSATGPIEMDTLTLTVKLGYGLGGFASSMVFGLVSVHLIFYYTDVCGISPAWAGAIFLVARIWDAMTDPMMGLLADHTRSKWGRYRPYILIGALPLAISTISLFSVASVGQSGRIAYAFVTYMLFTSLFTIVFVPYSALTSAVTKNTMQRAGLSAYRVVLEALGGIAATSGAMPLIHMFSDESVGYAAMSTILAIPAMLCWWLCVALIREAPRQLPAQSFPSLRIWRKLSDNTPFLLLAGAVVCGLIASNFTVSTLNYYFKYVIEREDLIGTAFLCLSAPVFIAVPVWIQVAARVGKRNTFLAGMLGVNAALLCIFLCPPAHPTFVLCLLAVLGFFGASGGFNVWSMLGDTVDYGEWKTGLRTEGLIHGYIGLFMKLGMGLAKLIIGFGLSVAGYSADEDQSATALFGICVLFSLAPFTINLVAIILLMWYPLDYQFCNRIHDDLARTDQVPDNADLD